MPRLLGIVELGGYPNLVPLYRSLGYEVDLVNSQRKARSYLKKAVPDVVVAEFNFQSDFRDRSSNLETLMSILQKYPQTRVLVLHMPEQAERVAALGERFDLAGTFSLPLDQDALARRLADLSAPA